MKDYRTRIYKQHSFRIQNAHPSFDKGEAMRWGIAYDTFLNGWLPEKKNAAILDIGCGGGKLLYFFLCRGFTNTQGVDISTEKIALSRQVSRNVFKADALEFIEAQKEKFDLLIGLDIVEHFKKDEVMRFLDACYNALKPFGRLVLQTPNAESPWGVHHRYGDFTHEVGFNPNSLERLLSLIGFVEILSREAGPVVHGILSCARYLIWKSIKAGLTLWNLAETGSKGSGIYTRVFLISGRKVIK